MTVERILDANANRAREALRVLEEAARFVLDDEPLTADLKAARHDLAGALAGFDGLEVHRDTPGDVGTRGSLPSERDRAGVPDVARAAGRRLGEALRALEEYGKTLDADAAARLEAIRYRGYDLERRILLALGARPRPQWRLCVLLTEDACGGRPWRDVADAVLAAGPDCVQVREKDRDDRTLLDRARYLLEHRRPGTAIVVNDRPDVALAAGADGVHLGQGDLPCAEVRRIVGPRLLIGVSTSRLEEARQALRDGADGCGVGPMYPSPTKHKPDTAGPAYLAEYVAWGRLPHLAIGGITPERLPALVAAGVRGVAVCAAVCGAEDPGAVIRAMERGLAATPVTTSAG